MAENWDGHCDNPYHRSDWSDGYCPGCKRGRPMPPPMTEEEREAYRNLPLCPNEDCEVDERWGTGCDCGPGTPYRRR